MKTIVFGGSGFLGSHVADELSLRGHDVIIYDRIESPYISDGQKMITGDILDREKVYAHVKNCDYVYSFAGIAGIEDARKNPLRTVETNILGTVNIVDACRQNNVRRFVFASTVYVYSDLAPFYRSSKQACELLIEDYQKTHGLKYTILRYGSLYGDRANHFNYIYKVVHQAIEEGRIVRIGSGEEIRDYIHVRDAAFCSAEILSKEYENRYVLFTGNHSIKIRDLLNMIKEIFHGEISIEYRTEREPGHYDLTPYSFRPKVAKKMIANNYYDLGQGILDIIYEIYSKSNKNCDELACIQKLIETDYC